ncbi:peptidyl-prolyl cis-trans isomerase [Desertimonas flava]|uniref:peptidyl-prolyl cis-trans isomerase n=1 Tax=Desertimonas flava TaxID=2064846 RepID=UPI000E345762|nr:peptidyl-prolyl cis-trans isomerase [Desertimonas flava]
MKLRSRALIVVAAAVVVAPGGGAPASAADVAATVNGTDITVDDFEATLLSLGAPDVAPADQVRTVLTEEIVNLVIVDALEAAGVDPDEGAEDDETFDARSARYRSLLADAGLVDVAERQEAYEEAGEVDGVMCLGLVAVDEADDDALDALRDALEAGDDFGAAATDAGFSPLAVGQSGPCFAVSTIPESLSEPLAEAVADAGVGELSEPIELEGSEYVVFAQPFEDVASLLTRDLAEAAVADLLDGVEVTVNSRYGRWDPATSSVVALDAPDAAESTDVAVAN